MIRFNLSKQVFFLTILICPSIGVCQESEFTFNFGMETSWKDQMADEPAGRDN